MRVLHSQQLCCHQTLKNCQNKWNNSSYLTIRKCRTMIPKRRESNEASPMNALTFCVELCLEWCLENTNQNISMSLQSLGERDLNEGRYLEGRIFEWLKLQMKIIQRPSEGSSMNTEIWRPEVILIKPRR